MPKLCYLDERPVFEIERICADAFVRGGADEEKRVTAEYAEKKRKRIAFEIERDVGYTEEGKKKRKEAFGKMIGDLKQKQPELVEEHEKRKKTWEDLPDGDTSKAYHLLQMRKVEDEMKYNWYKELQEKGKEYPKELGKPVKLNTKEYKDEQLSKKRRDIAVGKREQEL